MKQPQNKAEPQQQKKIKNKIKKIKNFFKTKIKDKKIR